MFVVCSEPIGDHSFKVFSRREDARTYARQQVDRGDADSASIFEAGGIGDVRAAIAALKMGEASFLESFGPHASEKQVKAAQLQELFRELGLN